MNDLNKLNFLSKLSLSNITSIKYFQVDATRYSILLIIFENFYKDLRISIEEIIELLPKDISSRAHQLGFLKEANIKGYLVKEISNSDNRVKYIRPSIGLIKDFHEHTNLFNQFLKDKKHH